jgi:hypothetical protein
LKVESEKEERKKKERRKKEEENLKRGDAKLASNTENLGVEI